MVLKSLALSNFRNYQSEALEFSSDINVIGGENAQGKTNLLEAIFFLSCAKSFHARREAELIRFSEPDAKITAEAVADGRELLIEILLSQNKKRRIFVNRVRQEKLFDYVGLIQTVLFSPEDLTLMKDGPGLRRRFCNVAISQMKPQYLKVLAEYQRILEQKNKLLRGFCRSPETDRLCDVYNDRLAATGASIISHRADLILQLDGYARQIHAEMSGEREVLSLTYRTDRMVQDPLGETGIIERELREHLEQRKRAEQDAQCALVGPHRDDLECCINDKPVRQFASQGQTRTAVLALKLAERRVFHAATGEFPILLLDDVLSELDAARRNYVLNQITDGQVFITSCEPDLTKLVHAGRLFSVKDGRVTE